jgi:hypothetical protein
MKTKIQALFLWFGFLLIMFAMSCLTSCSPTKPLADTKTEITKWEKTSDKSETNLAINDSLKLWIGKIKTARPECDSVTQIEIDRVLSQLSRYIQSGNNSYKLNYDLHKKVLSIIAKIGATTNREIKIEKGENKYFFVNRFTNILTSEQKFHVWIGRLFWVLLAVLITWKLKSKLSP